VSTNGRVSPSVEISSAPVIGIQVGLAKEMLLNDTVQSIDQTRNNQSQSILHDNSSSLPPKYSNNNQSQPSRKSPPPSEVSPNDHHEQKQQQHVTFQNESSKSNGNNETNVSIQSTKNVSTSKLNMQNNMNQMHEMKYITEEMQLKAAYELQLWKETKEREFEQEVCAKFITF
jgi:hypothetical protein